MADSSIWVPSDRVGSIPEVSENPSDIDFNALGQAIDTSWGRSSTPVTATRSVKVNLIGDSRMKVMYMTVVSFASNRDLVRVKKENEAEAGSVINQVVGTIKSTYKELAGRALKVKEVASDDSVEVIGLAVSNPNRTAYYRRTILFEVG